MSEIFIWEYFHVECKVFLKKQITSEKLNNVQFEINNFVQKNKNLAFKTVHINLPIIIKLELV